VKINRLYTKFLVSFLAILLVTEVLVIVLFIAIPAKRLSARLEDYVRRRALVVKELVEEKLQSSSGSQWSGNRDLQAFISDFSRVFGARVWLSSTDGASVVKSFPGSVPDVTEGITGTEQRDRGRFRFFWRSHSAFHYAVVPIEVSGKEVASLHVLFDRHSFPPPQGYFLSSLLVLGLVIAAAMVPVSQIMARRIKRLRQSALRISEGDLSHRAGIRGNDEIGELAAAFNGMTDKLQDMIVSGKELIANVSHELRSPLTRIRLAEEMLRQHLDESGEKGWRGNLNVIREEIDELDGLIGRILELSRLDLNKAPLKTDPVDLSLLIQDQIERHRPAIERRALDLDVHVMESLPIRGDRDALRSAVGNVIENACKFCSEGGAVRITAEAGPKEITIRVANSFARMTEEEVRLLFNPFHRKKGTDVPGYGLGLAIAKKAIERQRGRIEAESTAGEFTITIGFPRME
jgi:signal transduction histidine kinase